MFSFLRMCEFTCEAKIADEYTFAIEKNVAELEVTMHNELWAHKSFELRCASSFKLIKVFKLIKFEFLNFEFLN